VRSSVYGGATTTSASSRLSCRLALPVLMLAACGGADDSAAPAVAIPHTTVPIRLDGEWSEHDWPNVALRRQFYGDDGRLSRPSSEVRLLRDDAYVYVGLYAADDDIESKTDAFHLVIGDFAMRVDPLGRTQPTWPGVVVGTDKDGTVDDNANRDEEWLLEIGVPRELLPHGDVIVAASRCDTPRRTSQVLCGAWWGLLELP
jgi:hypothetical protein